MGLEAGTYLDDLNVLNPDGAVDSKSEGDNHLRLLKTVLKNTFPGLVGRAWRSQTKAGAYTAVANDNMTVLNCTATFTLGLTAAATLGNGWMAIVKANGGTVTVDPNAAETIDGAATLTLANGMNALIICTGTAFISFIMGTGFPSGTLMLFQQASAPAGWTKQTTHNDKSLRVVTGTPTSGGTDAFSSVFGAGKATAGHSITQAELPNCSFTDSGHTHTGTTGTESADHVHQQYGSDSVGGTTNQGHVAMNIGSNINTGPINVVASTTSSSSSGAANTGGRSAAHTHSFTTAAGSASVSSGGSGTAHTHGLTLDLQYVDVIIGAKD